METKLKSNLASLLVFLSKTVHPMKMSLPQNRSYKIVSTKSLLQNLFSKENSLKKASSLQKSLSEKLFPLIQLYRSENMKIGNIATGKRFRTLFSIQRSWGGRKILTRLTYYFF